MRKIIVGLLTALSLVGALFVGSGAATQATGGVSHTTRLSDGFAVTETRNPSVTLDAGSIKLMATGTTNAWYMDTPTLACGSAEISWDDLGAGASWKQTGSSTWNASFNSNGSGSCGNYDVGVRHSGPSQSRPGVCGSDCLLTPGQTSSLGTDYTGTGTSVVRWELVEGIGCRYFYMIPGSWDLDYQSSC